MARQTNTSSTTTATTEDSGSKQAEKVLKSGAPVSVGKATQFKPGQSGNPAGKPKGAISLATRIKNMMDDENFTTMLPDRRDGWKEFKGAPAEAIIRTAMLKAMQGDTKAADWLAKYGYGTKVEVEGEIKGDLVVKLVSYKDDGNSPTPQL